MTRFLMAFLFFLSLFCADSFSQDIPLGAWRIHSSYNRVLSVADAGGDFYAAGENGVVVLGKSERSIELLDKLNSLHGTGVSTIGYHSQSSQLLVAYDDGTFDVIKDNTVKNIDPSKNTVLTGSKTINNISFLFNEAYLSTDYGVLVFDMTSVAIKETWRDLGENGETVQILGSTFKGDSVFLATVEGILAGDLDDNLLDFHKWKRFNDGDFNATINFITTFNDQVFAALNGNGIFSYGDNGVWSKAPVLQGISYASFRGGTAHIVIGESNKVWLLNSAGVASEVTDAKFSDVNDALEDASGKIWVADELNGLVTNSYGTFESFVPNGPFANTPSDLTYHDGAMHLVFGGYNDQGVALQRTGAFSSFVNANWSSHAMSVKDLTSIAFGVDGKAYVGSYGYGVVEMDGDKTTLFNETNSSLINTSPPERNVNVTSVSPSTEGIWVANYGAFPSLHFYNSNGTWEPYSFPLTVSKFPQRLLTDYLDYVWMQLNPTQGGGLLVFDRGSQEHFYLTESDGSGELPSMRVYSLALDRDGYVWAGTDAGVAYFYDVRSDAVKPIFENRFLLSDDKVTAIAVDGGNRKWMGTERGVWLFNPTGEIALANFTATNSPLLSDRIVDIEIDPVTGEVFFATEKGVVSFRSDATESKASFDQIKIFPNPVMSNFNGQVGISGLATDAIVKITDVSGKLIFQTVANGGTASWDVRDHQGRRVSTGVFLVFAVKQDGSESMVGKVVVVN